jgi:hypothetical protein
MPLPSHAKKKAKKKKFVNERIGQMTSADHDVFDQLTKKQQKMITKGKIEVGYNSWMIKLALGEPYYNSEHHPKYTDYEQVWLYTKIQVEESVNENKIIDPVNNWPTIHRVKRVKKCQVGDFFLLFDRGVVEDVIPDKSEKVYGSCHLETIEEFLPIVKGKVVENPK